MRYQYGFYIDDEFYERTNWLRGIKIKLLIPEKFQSLIRKTSRKYGCTEFAYVKDLLGFYAISIVTPPDHFDRKIARSLLDKRIIIAHKISDNATDWEKHFDQRSWIDCDP
jgi:hypothetical protein